MSEIIDLRSDTVTRPSPAMRAAIAAAEVGDDVLGDDPTVNRLQERAAALLGMEAALYVPSGTMANQVAIRCVCEPGDELIIDAATHCYNYESGGPAALSGANVRTINGQQGIFTAEQVAAVVRPNSPHFARSRMVVVENTNNTGGGSIWEISQVASIRRVAEAHGLHLHMDGARLMNACVARGRAPTEYTKHVHSVAMCFSKGLGAPVGSVVAGSAAFIERARRFRKMFGGAMRQAGLLAAAALYALEHNVKRLAEDHANARRLAEGLAALPGVRINAAEVETNIVIFDIVPALCTAAEFVSQLRQRGVWLHAVAPQRVRAVTHLDVSAAQIERALAIFGTVCATTPVA